MYSKVIIPQEIFQKYNTEKCFKITFTAEGVERLKDKYRTVRALPAFLHNLLKGRPTKERNLFLENSNLFFWTPDCTAFTVPNRNAFENLFVWKNNPYLLKDDLMEGIALLVWVIDPRLLRSYGWKQNNGLNTMDSFKQFLLTNDNIHNISGNYRYFRKRDSQEKISDLEKKDPQSVYLATIMELTPTHLPFLKMLQESNYKHLIESYGVDPKKDKVEMYFHFPYPDSTTTLHMHIRINQARHPFEQARSFSISEIITCLEKNQKISELILKRKYLYNDNIDLLSDIEGICITETISPFFLTSPEVELCSGEENLEGFKSSEKSPNFASF
jgi:hypothetical protein